MARKSSGEGKFTKNNIRALREKTGLTQTALAAKVGISTSYLSNIEQFKRRTNSDTLARIGEVLGASMSSIVDVSGATLVVTVSSSCQAGAWFEGCEWPPEDRYEVTVLDIGNYVGIERHASEIRGGSMNKVYPDGSIIVWVAMQDIKEPLVPGKRYTLHATAKDGTLEHTVKSFTRDRSGREWFFQESDDPNYQVPTEYVAGEDGAPIVVGRVIMSMRSE
jgi:repressor LexA